MYKKRFSGKKTVYKRMIILFSVIIFLTDLFIFLLGRKLVPVVNGIVYTELCNDMTVEINTAVYEVLEKGGWSYSDMISKIADENGNIIALAADSVIINKIKNLVSLEISNSSLKNEREIFVPVGNLTDNALLAGRGPCIKVKVIDSKCLFSDVKSDFSSSGINQTLHRMYITITTVSEVITPFSEEKITLDTSVCIAETVIVGKVPDYYTNIVGASDELENDAVLYGKAG